MSFKFFFIALQIFSIITNPKRVNIIAVLTLFGIYILYWKNENNNVESL